MTQFYLASQSPRRAELLTQIGAQFTVISAPVDETVLANEAPHAYVERIAQAKAQAGWQRIKDAVALPVLGADTTVCLQQQALGKPADAAQARQMLQQLQGQTHEVITAVTICEQQRCESVVVSSKVSFCALSATEIDAYVATGEPLDKAGAYAIQGRAAKYVSQLVGSYSAVVGLPLYETAQLLKRFNITV